MACVRIIPDRFGGPPELQVGEAAAIQRNGQSGIESQGLVAIGERGLQIVRRGPRPGPVVVGIGILGSSAITASKSRTASA
jgi:hypothetical protein